MSFVLTKKLPTPMEIKELYPVSEELAALKAEKDQELIDIITGASDHLKDRVPFQDLADEAYLCSLRRLYAACSCKYAVQGQAYL